MNSTFNGHGLTFFPTVLAFISTIIGGGIVGIPAAFYSAGIPLAIAMNLLVGASTIYSAVFYLRARDMTGRTSFSEIGYIVWGRKSIFIINFIIFFNSFGLMMIYFIVFSGIASSLVKIGISDSENATKFYAEPKIYVLFIALLCAPLCLKREIKELKLASYLLFGGIAIFIVFMIVMLISDPDEFNPDKTKEPKEYYKVYVNRDLITAISVMLVAYSYQQNLYSTFKSMAKKTTNAYMKASSFAIFLSIVIYSIIAILALYIFGSSL
jgi:amino acid permease